ncbi:hypothetical protein MTO96_002246 [Rhipicephalus appendiculatus]
MDEMKVYREKRPRIPLPSATSKRKPDKSKPLGQSKKVRREAPKKCEEELLNEMGGSAVDMAPRSTHQALQQRLQALEAEMELLKEQVERNKEPTAEPLVQQQPTAT